MKNGLSPAQIKRKFKVFDELGLAKVESNLKNNIYGGPESMMHNIATQWITQKQSIKGRTKDVIKKFGFPISVCIGLISNFAGLTTLIVNLFGYDMLIYKAESILKTHESVVQKTFILLSEIEALLLILKTVQVGVSILVSFHVQLGQILSPLIRLHTTAWKISLASMTSLVFVDYLLRFSQWIAIPFLSIILIFLLAEWGLNHWNITIFNWFYRLKKLSIALLCIIVIGLPVVIIGAGSSVISFHHPHAKKIHTQLARHHKSIANHSITSNLNSQAHTSHASYLSARKMLPEKLILLTHTVPRHIALTLLDTLLFPGVVSLYLALSMWLLFKKKRILFVKFDFKIGLVLMEKWIVVFSRDH